MRPFDRQLRRRGRVGRDLRVLGDEQAKSATDFGTQIFLTKLQTSSVRLPVEFRRHSSIRNTFLSI